MAKELFNRYVWLIDTVAALRKAYPQEDRRVVATERIFGRQADGSTDVYELSSGHTGDV